MIIPYLIGFMIGSIFTLLVGSYVISITYENEIKKDILVDELLKENKTYKDFVDKQFNELNGTDWS